MDDDDSFHKLTFLAHWYGYMSWKLVHLMLPRANCYATITPYSSNAPSSAQPVEVRGLGCLRIDSVYRFSNGPPVTSRLDAADTKTSELSSVRMVGGHTRVG